jgi:hypothetical protein
MLCRHSAYLRRHRRHVALMAAILALAGGVVVAHSPAGAEHMGEAVAVCLAVAETAALGALALTTPKAWVGARLWGLVTVGGTPRLVVPARPPLLPWPRGSPFALQVLRL